MEVYESHLGGFYYSDEIIPFEFLFCDQCGDRDYHLGHADTWEEVLDLITDCDGWPRYASDYIAKKKAEFDLFIKDKIF